MKQEYAPFRSGVEPDAAVPRLGMVSDGRVAAPAFAGFREMASQAIVLEANAVDQPARLRPLGLCLEPDHVSHNARSRRFHADLQQRQRGPCRASVVEKRHHGGHHDSDSGHHAGDSCYRRPQFFHRGHLQCRAGCVATTTLTRRWPHRPPGDGNVTRAGVTAGRDRQLSSLLNWRRVGACLSRAPRRLFSGGMA